MTYIDFSLYLAFELSVIFRIAPTLKTTEKIYLLPLLNALVLAAIATAIMIYDFSQSNAPRSAASFLLPAINCALFVFTLEFFIHRAWASLRRRRRSGVNNLVAVALLPGLDAIVLGLIVALGTFPDYGFFPAAALVAAIVFATELIVQQFVRRLRRPGAQE